MVCHAHTVSRHTPPILVRLSATPMLANKSYRKLVAASCACAVATSAGSAIARVDVPSVVVSIMAGYAPRVQILPMPFHQFRTGQVLQLLLPSLERIYLFPAQPHLEMNLPQPNSRLSMQVLLRFSPKIHAQPHHCGFAQIKPYFYRQRKHLRSIQRFHRSLNKFVSYSTVEASVLM